MCVCVVYTRELACRGHVTSDLASLNGRDGARPVFAGRGPPSITEYEAPWFFRQVT